MLKVAPLKRVTLADTVVTQLRREILAGRLKPGQQIPPEMELCEAFGVGRTTVREALRDLVTAGFVARNGKRLVVTDPSHMAQEELDYAALAARVSVLDLYETRKLLEVQLAKLAAEQHQEGDLDELHACLEVTETAEQVSYHTADAEFHSAIARMGKNVVLTEVYEKTRNLFFRLPTYWRVFGQRPNGQPNGGIDGASGGHRRIFQAIAARDSDAAAKAVFEHLDVVERRLIALIDPSHAAGDIRVESAGSAQLIQATGD